jgi:long-chain acyl-CoA synthetase
MKGYYLNDHATSESIKDNWLYTGDLGYMDEDGFLVVVGREKALLISANGEKYSPEGVEEAIINCAEFIQQVMVYNDMKPYTVAVVTLADDKIRRLISQQTILTPEMLIQLIEKDIQNFKSHPSYKDQFPDIWIPNYFVIANEAFTEQNLMINSTLKMVRHKVLENYKTAVEALYNQESSKNNNPHNLNIAGKYFVK